MINLGLVDLSFYGPPIQQSFDSLLIPCSEFIPSCSHSISLIQTDLILLILSPNSSAQDATFQIDFFFTSLIHYFDFIVRVVTTITVHLE